MSALLSLNTAGKKPICSRKTRSAATCASTIKPVNVFALIVFYLLNKTLCGLIFERPAALGKSQPFARGKLVIGRQGQNVRLGFFRCCLIGGLGRRHK